MESKIILLSIFLPQFKHSVFKFRNDVTRRPIVVSRPPNFGKEVDHVLGEVGLRPHPDRVLRPHGRAKRGCFDSELASAIANQPTLSPSI